MIIHGTRSCYVKNRCRQLQCIEASSKYERERLRKKRLLNPLPIKPSISFISPTDLAWVAGLLEGEGSFLLNDKGVARISIEMTDGDVLDKLSKIVGIGRVIFYPSRNPKWKNTYRWCLYGKPVKELCALLLPYMGKRRSEKILRILQH